MAIDDFIDKRCFVPAGPGEGLTAALAESYNENGFAILRGRVPAATVEALRPKVDTLLEANHRTCKDIAERDPAVAEFMGSDAVTGAVEAFNGPSALLQSFAFAKLPGEERTKHWHQDGVYWDMSDSRVACAFVAMTETTPENGCIYCVPGSHRLGRIYHATEPDEFGLQNLACDVSSLREPVALEMAPGDVAVVHTLTVHASFDNRTDRPRINLGFHMRHRDTRARTLEPYRKSAAA